MNYAFLGTLSLNALFVKTGFLKILKNFLVLLNIFKWLFLKFEIATITTVILSKVLFNKECFITASTDLEHNSCIFDFLFDLAVSQTSLIASLLVILSNTPSPK